MDKKSKKSLDDLRAEIDQLDQQILDLLNRRAGCATSIGDLKQETGRAIYDPERERAVIDALLDANGGPVPDKAVKDIFQRIILTCRHLEAPPKVAFLGPEQTFSHQAVLSYFGSVIELEPLADLPDVAEAVARGEVDYGILPLENSIEGVVGTTLDLVVESGVQVIGELVLPVELHLVASAPLPEVEVVYSHAQPLRQARHWLRSHLPDARQVTVSSTAEAARRATSEKNAAAVVSPLAAEASELQVKMGPVEDRPDNRTRFWIISRDRQQEGNKSSVLLVLPHEAGSLSRALQAFAAHDVNMTMIISRPAHGQPWEYRFFLDLAGNAYKEGAEAIQAVQKTGAHVRILGVYSASPEPA